MKITKGLCGLDNIVYCGLLCTLGLKLSVGDDSWVDARFGNVIIKSEVIISDA